MSNVSLDEILPEKLSIIEDMGGIASKIAYYNFEWRYVTLIMISSVQNIVASDIFLKHYNQSVIIKLGKFIPHRRINIPQFVIFGHNSYEIVDTIAWLDKSSYDNSGKYIIICTSLDKSKCDERQVFNALRHVYIINIIYIRPTNETCFELFSYDLIVPGNCENSEPYKIHMHSNCANDECLKSLYTKKLNDFQKCPLVVSTFEQPPYMYIDSESSDLSGGDGDIVNLVAQKLNATLRVKIPEEGNDWGRYENNNWTGSLGDVYNLKVHMSVSAMPLSAYTYGNFTSSYVYNTMDIVWVAAAPPLKPSWQKLLQPLDSSIRIGLFFMFAGIALINAATKLDVWKRVRKVLKIGHTTSSLLFYSWALFLGMSIVKMPSRRSILLLVYSWIWYSFVIRNAYQAALMNCLKTKAYEDFFEDFESVLKGRYPYGGFENAREYYSDETSIYENWKVLDFNETYNVLDDICNESSDFVLALHKENLVQHLVDRAVDSRVQILPQKIVNSPIVMYFKKHSIVASSVNSILRVAMEAGFTQIMHTKFLRHKKFIIDIQTNNSYEPLTLDNFKSCMLLLVCGWCMALIFFIAEAYCSDLEDDEF